MRTAFEQDPPGSVQPSGDPPPAGIWIRGHLLDNHESSVMFETLMTAKSKACSMPADSLYRADACGALSRLVSYIEEVKS